MASAASAVSSILEKVILAAREVYNRIKAVDQTNHQRRQLIDNAETLLQILENVQSQQSDISVTPVPVNKSLWKIQSILQNCIGVCDELEVRSRRKYFDKLVSVNETKSKLSDVSYQLQTAISLLNGCISITCLESIKELCKKVEHVEGVARNPYAGVYPEAGYSNALKGPDKIKKPFVECDGDLLRVEWNDKCNPPGRLNGYEIQYDDHNPHAILRLNSDCTAVKLGREVLKPGRTYTIRVRGVNNKGPGEWSESTVCRFLNCPPEQPPKPLNVQINSSTSAMLLVSASVLQNKTGDPVTHIIVEKCDENSTEWSSEAYSPEKLDYTCGKGKSTVAFSFNDLGEGIIYQFRIKLRNQVGDSLPSEAIAVKTDDPIPGIPMGLRLSSKRTTKILKVRWDEPDKNAHAVHKYEVECSSNKGLYSDCMEQSSTKLSATFTQLESNSKYGFRVRAVNKAGKPGNWSSSIVAETRKKGAKKAKAVAAGIGVGVGAFLTSPVVYGGVGAVCAGIAAAEHREEKGSGKGAQVAAGTAAGVAAGIGMAIAGTLLAPVAGITSGITAGYLLNISDVSPQSSDGELESD